MERLKLRFSGSFYNSMQKMSKGDYMEMDCTLCNAQLSTMLKLVSKELNHFAAILHVYAGGLILMK